MDGLIMRPPLAEQIIEHDIISIRRNIGVPRKYLKTTLLLMSQGNVLGKIMITDFGKMDALYYEWKIKVIEKFNKPLAYIPSGRLAWAKNVKFETNPVLRIWIRSVNPLYWNYVKKYNCWKVKGKNKTIKIRKGDYIIFYVTSTRSFYGIFEVTSDWHAPMKFDWPGEENHQDRFDYQIELKPRFKGRVRYNDLSTLNFLNKNTPGICLQSNPTGVSNFGRPITESDFNLIKTKMKKIEQI